MRNRARPRSAAHPRLHDYAAIYDVPGLYERLFAELLECNSPAVVCDLLGTELAEAGVDPAMLTALDFGAGNGMVGERPSSASSRSSGSTCCRRRVTPPCAIAPGSTTTISRSTSASSRRSDRAELDDRDFNAMVCVAALGFGDIPPAAFAEAFNFVSSPGWIAMNLRERFIDDDDPAGFGSFIGRMLDEGVLEEHARTTYTHRVSVSGEPLEHVALVASKRDDVPPDWARTS